jgi:hypothetical protein
VTHTVYDHTSTLKSILERFLRFPDGSTPPMPARVDAASGFWHELQGSARTDCTPAPLPPPQTTAAVLSPETVRALQNDPAGHAVAFRVRAQEPPLNDVQAILKSVGEQVDGRIPVTGDPRLLARFR